MLKSDKFFNYMLLTVLAMAAASISVLANHLPRNINLIYSFGISGILGLLCIIPFLKQHFKPTLSLMDIFFCMVAAIILFSAIATFVFVCKMQDELSACVLWLVFPVYLPIIYQIRMPRKIPAEYKYGLALVLIGGFLMLNPWQKNFNTAALIGLMSGFLTAISFRLYQYLLKKIGLINVLLVSFGCILIICVFFALLNGHFPFRQQLSNILLLGINLLLAFFILIILAKKMSRYYEFSFVLVLITILIALMMSFFEKSIDWPSILFVFVLTGGVIICTQYHESH